MTAAERRVREVERARLLAAFEVFADLAERIPDVRDTESRWRRAEQRLEAAIERYRRALAKSRSASTRSWGRATAAR